MKKNKNDDNDEEIPSVLVKAALNGLETFINFFEQQNDFEFNVDIFRRYLRVARVKEINSKKQNTLDLSFTIVKLIIFLLSLGLI